MIKEINSLVLAYLGDTIYEDFVREYLIKKGIANVNDLQTESIKYSSAKDIVNMINNKDFISIKSRIKSSSFAGFLFVLIKSK